MSTTPSLENSLATNDPGDETQRNFRYQYGYGVILLIAGATKSRPYKAVWCEHHEDLLAERIDDNIEAYQIKTRRPENGDWDLKDEEIIHCLKRFVNLESKYTGRFIKFAIVSNAEFMSCAVGILDKKRLKKSPVRFFEAIRNASSPDDIAPDFIDVFESFCATFPANKEKLFNVFKKVELIKGPPRDNFETDISHNHLATCEGCDRMSPASLNKIRDEIIQRVFQASSLSAVNVEEHLHDRLLASPFVIAAKRLSIDVVKECITQSSEMIFRYQSVDGTIDLNNTNPVKTILKQKLEKGNLEGIERTMNRRTISAERRLLERGYDLGERSPELLSQLESIVQGECDEAALEALSEIGSMDSPDFGVLMYNKVSARLKDIAQNRPAMVWDEPYETLIGIAGLLTENCSVWWSKKFIIAV